MNFELEISFGHPWRSGDLPCFSKESWSGGSKKGGDEENQVCEGYRDFLKVLQSSRTPGLRYFGRWVEELRKTLQYLQILAKRSWRQAILPVKFGGFGMTSCCCISRHAFVASWVYTLKELPIRYPDLQPALGLLVSSNDHRGSI